MDFRRTDLCGSRGVPVVAGLWVMHSGMSMREFPKIRVPYLGVPIIRILLFRLLY